MAELGLTNDVGEGAAWLGRAHLQVRSGDLAGAEVSLERAGRLGVEVAPSVWSGLGIAWAGVGEFERSSRAFSRAVEANPVDAAARVNLGNALRLLGRLDEAEAQLRGAIERAPGLAEAHGNLGLVLTALGRHDEALACHDRVVSLRPVAASSHHHRGVTLAAMGRVDDAEAAFRRALELDPGCFEAPVQLGLIASGRGEKEAALEWHRAAASLKPDDAGVCVHLGNALRALGRVGEAVVCFERSVGLEPGFAEARSNLGITRLQEGRVAEALAEFDAALRLRPDLAEARVNRAQARLSLGDLARGWPENEWRRRLPGSTVATLPGPEWDGSPLTGQAVLLHGEQGQGDMIQFARFAAEVRARGGRPRLRVHRPLMTLLARCPGVARVFPMDEPSPDVPLHVPLMSLPGRLGLDRLEDLGRAVPYIEADPHLAEAIGRQIGGPGGGVRLGMAWQGNPRFVEDWHRSIPLESFLPLGRVRGVRAFVLQQGPALGQLDALADRWRPRRLDSPGGEPWGWEQTAAAIGRLDLVITSDSAVAHLAGAMGRPVWVALSAAADWRWLRDRQDSPWYPSMRLYRQATWGRWDDVFDRIARDLARW